MKSRPNLHFQTWMRSMTCFLFAVATIIGLAMQMSHRNHQEVISIGCVNDSVGKACHTISPRAFAQGMPCFGIPLDKPEHLDNLDQENISKTRSLGIVPDNGLIQYFASTSDRGTAAMSPRW